jgi:hypothetical protein
MPLLHILITASMILLLFLSAVSNVISSNNPCSQCHRSTSETCSFEPTNSQSKLPSSINTQTSSIKIAVQIKGDRNNYFYRIAKLQVTLYSMQGNVEIKNQQQTMTNLYPGDTPVFLWQVTGVTPGTDSFHFTLSAFNSHQNVDFSDSYSYPVVVAQGNGSSGPQTAVEPSVSTLRFHESGGTITLFIKQPIENLQINPPSDISVQPDFVAQAQTGDEIKVTFTSTSKTIIQGTATISWSENNNPGEITLNLEYNTTPQQPIDYYSLIGRITAISLLSLLIVSMLIGGASKRINTFIKKRINAKQKNELHCLISWIFFELALFHGVILLIGPYRDFIWNTNVILGYITAVGFFIVAVNGRFMTIIISKIGANLWRKIHKYVTWGALLLCITHAILIGTEFALLRGLLKL